MTIGELDRRIALDYPTYSTNDYGEVFISDYSDFRTVWAKVEWIGGSETDETDKITGTAKVNFYIRNLDLDDFLDGTSAPTMGHRINFGKYYYLHNVEQIEANRFYLHCAICRNKY